jgi:hypothetical protein
MNNTFGRLVPASDITSSLVEPGRKSCMRCRTGIRAVPVNGQPKMDINGHEKSPQTANSQEVKARSFSKLIGMSNQYNFEGASKLDESGDCRENP